MYKIFSITISLFLLVSCGAEAQNKKEQTKPIELKNAQDSISYIIGTQWGGSLAMDSVKVNIDALKQGIVDALSGNQIEMDQAKVDAMMQALVAEINVRRQQGEAIKQEETNKMAGVNLQKGKEFLEQNKTKPGVKVTASGLQYKEITPGTGKAPKATSKVKVHYKGTFINGEEFDSSYKRGEPIEFPLSGVIKGWTEGLQLMKVGGKMQFYIPSELAYGENAHPSIGPNQVLIFDVELLDVID
ncbi:MAG: FKBP-type peptidyl-prolyl cis-trans isomerase [Desulfobulbaceae bacterium]|nr:FKBP-type peptidyl-prolyl cis-trans isomerase [Desulfobulbaceae bacterium]